MALFPNEELVLAYAPNGQSTQVPRSLLDAFPDLSTTPPGAPAGQQIVADPSTGLVPSRFNSPPAPIVQETPAPPLPVDAISGAGPIRETAPTPAPQAPASENNAAVAGSYAAPLVDLQKAVSGQKSAAKTQAEAEIEAADATATEYEDHLNKIVAINKAAEDKYIADQQEAQKIDASLSARVDRRAKTKIDRGIDHPILAAIGVILGGIAQARGATKNNAGMDALFAAIDRKVAGQMRDLEKGDKDIALGKEHLLSFKTDMASRLASRDGMMAAEVSRAAIALKAHAAKTSSAVIKADLEMKAAKLDELAGNYKLSAVEKERDHVRREKDRQEQARQANQGAWLQKRGQDIGVDQFAKTQAFLREKEANDLEIALLNARGAGASAEAKAKAELAKDASQRGLNNVAMAKPLFNKKGTALWEQSVQLEAQADALEKTNPSAAAVIRAKAQDVRLSAREHQVMAPDPNQKGAMQETYVSVQGMVTLIEDINELYDRKDGGKAYIETTAGQQALQSLGVQLMMKLKDAWHLGVLSKPDAALINIAKGDDPTKWDAGTIAHNVGIEIGKDPEGFKAALDTLVNGGINDIELKLKGTGWDGDGKENLFLRRKPQVLDDVDKISASLDQYRTASEMEKFGKRDDGMRTVTDSKTGKDRKVYDPPKDFDPEKGLSTKFPGMSEPMGQAWDDLMMRAEGGSKKAEDTLVAKATVGRGSFQDAAMNGLYVYRPDLYEKAKKINTRHNPSEHAIDQRKYNASADKNIAKSRAIKQFSTLTTPNLFSVARMVGKGSPEELAVLEELKVRADRQEEDAVKALQKLKTPGGTPKAR